MNVEDDCDVDNLEEQKLGIIDEEHDKLWWKYIRSVDECYVFNYICYVRCKLCDVSNAMYRDRMSHMVCVFHINCVWKSLSLTFFKAS